MFGYFNNFGIVKDTAININDKNKNIKLYSVSKKIINKIKQTTENTTPKLFSEPI